MITIIAGSRSCIEYNHILQAAAQAPWEITRIISGGARGADNLGEKFGKRMGIPVSVMYANWEREGRRAGLLRNIAMAEVADALIALWDGQSKGTKHMIDAAHNKGLKVFVWEYTAAPMVPHFPKVIGL